jgi:hypothetical protein
MPRDRNQDPYAPPPRYKERSGAVMRFIILAALLGAAAWAYVTYSGQQQTASLTSPAQQEVADSGYRANPTPEAAAPAATTPAPAATPAQQAPTRTTTPPARRSSSSSAEQDVPPPSTSIDSTPG